MARVPSRPFGIIQVQIIPQRDLLSDFEGASTQLLPRLREVARSLGPQWVAIARSYVPRRTGEYSQSINYRVYARENGVDLRGFSERPKGTWIALGTKAHIIRPRQAKWLVFYWEKLRRVVRLPLVHHPGARPSDWVRRALDDLSPEVEKQLFGILEGWGARFSRGTRLKYEVQQSHDLMGKGRVFL